VSKNENRIGGIKHNGRIRGKKERGKYSRENHRRFRVTQAKTEEGRSFAGAHRVTARKILKKAQKVKRLSRS